jgi:hypothetical protein
VVRPGAVAVFNLCGNPEVVAETELTDYTWAVSLAQGDACPPFPEPDLPDAQCLRAPCQ